MPQLDKFTYLTQFFWFSLFFFSFYIFICNYGNGLLWISRILKLRNQLLSHRGNNIQSKDPNSSIYLKKDFSTGLSYMYSSLFEVSQWCKAECKRMKITLISCFGEINGSQAMEKIIDFFFILIFLMEFEWYPFLVLIRSSLGKRVLSIKTMGTLVFILLGMDTEVLLQGPFSIPSPGDLVSHLTEDEISSQEPQGTEETVTSKRSLPKTPILAPNIYHRISLFTTETHWKRLEQELKSFCSLPSTIDRFPSLGDYNMDYSFLVKPMLGNYPFFIQTPIDLDKLFDDFDSGKKTDRNRINKQFTDFIRDILEQ